MKKFIIIFLLAAVHASGMQAQDIYAPALEQIARNCPEINLFEKECEAEKAQNSTGLAPSNPEVEVGYLWGNEATGNRKDLSVKQEFDFPTVYGNRRALAKERDNAASHLLKARRTEVLLEAKELLVQLVYFNALHQLASSQLSFAREIMDSYEKLMAKGETTQLDYNKASMNLAAFENELARIGVERRIISNRLKSLNGGEDVAFDLREFPPQLLPTDFGECFAEAEQQNPALKHLRSQINVSRRNVSVVKASNLPKISVGFTGEYVMGSNFQGVTAGVSIPLWENRNKVRHAKTETAVAEAALVDARQDYYHSLRSLFEQAQTFCSMEDRYVASLGADSNAELLYKALTKGRLTLLDYVTEVQYDFTMREKLLATQRDRELALAKLYSYKL